MKIKIVRCGFFKKLSGLMFSRKENSSALLFEFKKKTFEPIHSFFVFFKFVAVWLDDENKVVDCKIIKPWRINISPKKPYKKLLEIPINKKYENKINDIFKTM